MGLDFKTSVHVLACYDECDDSAFSFLSELRNHVLRDETELGVLIITTKGSPNDERIASALSEFPSDTVTSFDHVPPKPPPSPVAVEASILVQQQPQYVEDGLYGEVRLLLSKIQDDRDLYNLLAEWLRTARQPAESLAKLLENESLPPGIVFATALAEIPKDRRSWARAVLLWMVTALRSLRVAEFCWVSDHLWVETDERDMHALTKCSNDPRRHVANVLCHFNGLLEVVHGEVRFRHSATRDWLLSQDEAADSGVPSWLQPMSEVERHQEVLETCLSYLCDETEDEQSWAEKLPYATQFWVMHYQKVPPLRKVTTVIFENESRFQRWTNAYIVLSTPLLKPLLEGLTPLSVAAYFGLHDVVKSLLVKYLDDSEARGHALVEAARTGQLAVIRLIVDSYSSGLEFDDDHLHQATRLVDYSGNPQAFRELVNSIPEPPYPIPPWSLRTGELEPTTEQPHDPFHWLAVPLYQAACLGLQDVITKLLALGANLDYSMPTTTGKLSPLQVAAGRSHSNCVKLLIDAGANLAARDSRGYSSLHLASIFSSGHTAKTLLENGSAIDDEDTSSFKLMPLEMAVIRGCFDTLEVLLQHRDPQEYLKQDPEKHPVNLAVQNGNRKCLELLLRHGFKTNVPDVYGKTALWSAVTLNRLDLCRILLENGADPDFTPEEAETPLIEAVLVRNLDIVKLLVEHGADIHKTEMPGAGWRRTPSLPPFPIKKRNY